MSDYRNSLSSLLAALQGGLAGTQAQGILGGIMDQRAQAQAQKQAEMQQLASSVVNAAQGGASYGSIDQMIATLTQGWGPRRTRRANRIQESAFGLDPGSSRMAYYEPGGGGYDNISKMTSPQVLASMTPEPDYDAATAAILPQVLQLAQQAFANGKSAIEIKEAIASDPEVGMLYVKNPSLFDDLIQQAQYGA